MCNILLAMSLTVKQIWTLHILALVSNLTYKILYSQAFTPLLNLNKLKNKLLTTVEVDQ